MMELLPFLLLLGAACGLSCIQEIERLDRDLAPRQEGRRFLLIFVSALVLTLLFTLWSADAGLILLTLTQYLGTALLGIRCGHRIALTIYRRRNPELLEEEN